jgi:hypothetical protein
MLQLSENPILGIWRTRHALAAFPLVGDAAHLRSVRSRCPKMVPYLHLLCSHSFASPYRRYPSRSPPWDLAAPTTTYRCSLASPYHFTPISSLLSPPFTRQIARFGAAPKPCSRPFAPGSSCQRRAAAVPPQTAYTIQLPSSGPTRRPRRHPITRLLVRPLPAFSCPPSLLYSLTAHTPPGSPPLSPPRRALRLARCRASPAAPPPALPRCLRRLLAPLHPPSLRTGLTATARLAPDCAPLTAAPHPPPAHRSPPGLPRRVPSSFGVSSWPLATCIDSTAYLPCDFVVLQYNIFFVKYTI